VKNEWGGGLTVNPTVATTGAGAINGWKPTRSFPGDQKTTSAWDATISQTGSAASATNPSYNAAFSLNGTARG
jgi:endoglucanase